MVWEKTSTYLVSEVLKGKEVEMVCKKIKQSSLADILADPYSFKRSEIKKKIFLNKINKKIKKWNY